MRGNRGPALCMNETTILDSKRNPDRLTSAVSALHDLAIVRQTSIGQALEIVFSITRPTLLEVGTHCLVGEVVTDNEFAVQLALEVNQADDILTLFLL